MSEDTERLMRWLTGFVAVLAVLGFLCGFGLRGYSIIQSGALAAITGDYSYRTYDIVGKIVMYTSIGIFVLWAVFVGIFQMKYGSFAGGKRRKPSIMLISALAALVLGRLFRMFTESSLLVAAFYVAVLLLSLGVGMLWRERSA